MIGWSHPDRWPLAGARHRAGEIPRATAETVVASTRLPALRDPAMNTRQGSLASRTKPGGRSARPRPESLEGRCLLATFAVSNTDFSGPGSFGQAISDSNATAGGVNTIVFNIPGTGPHTIPIIQSGNGFP